MKLIVRTLLTDPVDTPLISAAVGSIVLIVGGLAVMLGLIGRLTAIRLDVRQR